MSEFQAHMLGAIHADIKALRRDIRELRRAVDKGNIPRADAWIKTLLSIAAPIATLFATGSVTKALEVAAMFAR